MHDTLNAFKSVPNMNAPHGCIIFSKNDKKYIRVNSITIARSDQSLAKLTDFITFSSIAFLRDSQTNAAAEDLPTKPNQKDNNNDMRVLSHGYIILSDNNDITDINS
jgi:hypothetical protein